MRYLIYWFIFNLSSCQLKNDSSNGGTKDTTQTSITQIDNPTTVRMDSSLSTSKQKSDTIFLGFRIGMIGSEFEKCKQDLLQKRKLKLLSKDLVYQIKVDENEFKSIFTSSEDNFPKKIWIGNGIVVPDFLDNKLISISIKFLNTNGNYAWSFFLSNLNKKYYEVIPEFKNYNANYKKVDTLTVGNSVKWYVENNWSLGDISISLRFDHESLKIADNEFKYDDDVIVKYWSVSYYNEKRDKKTNEKIKETNEVQSGL